MTPEADIDARFEVLERIGRGSWGEVHRAKDRETGEIVAVKRLHAHVDDQQAIERFHREARLLARVTSPHVVRYVASGIDARGAPYLVTEWLAGEDLGKRHKRAPLGGVEMVDVVRQIARGLDALHLAGIVHRDVKPSNVFLAEPAQRGGAPVAKLIDLGVAHGRAEQTLTVQGVAIGTPYYMSPEQARGDEEITAASDVFSLGVVLFELCAGRRPFRGDDLFAVLAKIVLTDPPRLRDEAPDAPPELAAIVARALSKEPSTRFGSARELDHALAGVPAFRTAGAEATVDDGEVPTILGTQGLSGSLEQRVVTAVFAKLPLGLDDAGPKAAFTAIATEADGAPYPLLGRNVVAVFGGHRTKGDEVARAARAALRVSHELVGSRVVVVTGRAVADIIGLAGAVVERGAAELERARAGAVRVDANTTRLLGDAFEVEMRGDARVLVGARAPREGAAPRPPRTLLGKPTPCVGRDRELSMLDALFAECADESVARAALVTGGPGSGKSRLRAEFLSRVELAGAAEGRAPLVLFGRGDVLAAGSPFALLGGAIRRAAGVVEAEPAELRRDKVRALAVRSASGDADAEAIAEGLCEIAAVSGRRDGVDAMVAGDRIRAAWEAFLEAEARARPVVLVLEDLHWGDLSSVRLVDAALLACASSPLLVVALSRPEIAERFPNLWAERDVQRVPLPPLGKRAAERLAKVALGDAATDVVVRRIVDRADGSPFFLEELIRAVAEHGPDAPMPDTVLGVVQARLDALGPDAKRVLRAASVFGDAFWRGGVHAILGGARSSAGKDELDDLAAREILTKRAVARFAGESEYVFRHALVRDASYATLVEGDRALAHRLAAQWLEAVGERDAVTLAEHNARGERPEAARRHWLAAAEQALYGSDFVAAGTFAERARAGRDDALAGAALLVDAESHRWRGELADASDRAITATTCLAPSSAPWFQALREVIVANGRLAKHDAVEAWARISSEAEPAAGAEGAQIGSLAPAAVYLTYAGREEGAEQLVARVEALVARAVDLDAVLLARVHQLRAVRAGHRLDTEGALIGHTAALEAFTRGGDARNAALSSANIGFVLGQLGQLEAAEDALRRAHQTAERLRLSTIGPLTLHNLGLVLANLGRFDEARHVEERAVEAFARQGDGRLERASRVYLARILDLAGDVGGAAREARAVLDTTADGTARVGALAILARALLAEGASTAEALIVASEANDLLASTPVEEWEWESLTRMTLVDALDRTGQPGPARGVLREALERLASRVDSLRDPVLRGGAVERIPEHARMIRRARELGVPVPEALGA